MTLTDRTNALIHRFILRHGHQPAHVLLGMTERIQASQEHHQASGGEIATGLSDPGHTNTFCGLQTVHLHLSKFLAVGTVLTEQ